MLLLVADRFGPTINSRRQAMTETTDVRMTTRRKLLTRDLKAICALTVAPIVGQMILPDQASAHEHDSRSDSWGFGSSRHPSGLWAWGGDGQGNDDGISDLGDRGRDKGNPGGKGGYGGSCFLQGTRILTATGERRIEDIAAGDLVRSAFGGIRPVQSIEGFRRFRRASKAAWTKDARPVRIARSALAPDVPHHDLYVTQGHALFFGDILIPASALINGTTISLYPAHEHDELEFFHLQLESHDVIYAEGAPCETLLCGDVSMKDGSNGARKDHANRARQLHCAPIICNG